MMTNKEEFIELLRSTNRDGVEDCIVDLQELGFFEAPASTKFHLNEEGGLVQHSLNLCHVALKVRESMIELDDSLRELLPKDSVIISTLLHDVCKADIYKKAIKRQKNAYGMWTDVSGYDVDYYNFPVGHGEKSVMMITEYMKLTSEEKYAIRWHMGYTEPKELYSTIGEAYKRYPLALLMHEADLEATYFFNI